MTALLFVALFLTLGVVGLQARKRTALEAELAALQEICTEFQKLQDDFTGMNEETRSELQEIMDEINAIFGAPRPYAGGTTHGSALVRAAGEAAWEDLAEDRLIPFKSFRSNRRRSTLLRGSVADFDESEFEARDFIPNPNVAAPDSKSQA